MTIEGEGSQSRNNSYTKEHICHQIKTQFHCNKTANTIIHQRPIKLIDERRRIQSALESIQEKDSFECSSVQSQETRTFCRLIECSVSYKFVFIVSLSQVTRLEQSNASKKIVAKSHKYLQKDTNLKVTVLLVCKLIAVSTRKFSMTNPL